MPPRASIVVSAVGDPRMLDETLAAVGEQAAAASAEVLLAGGDRATAERHGARYVPVAPTANANAARNEGVQVCLAELIVLIDHDVVPAPGWLDALLEAARSEPHHDAFVDTTGVSLAVRRRAWRRGGGFAEGLDPRAGADEWQRRLRSDGGRIGVVEGARAARPRASLAADFASGRHARRAAVLAGTSRALPFELRGLVRARDAGAAAHALGRLRGWAERDAAARGGKIDADFLSGSSGRVAGVRATTRAAARDALHDGRALATGRRRRLARAGGAGPRRRVLVLGIERTDRANLMDEARAELLRSRHDVEVHVTPAEDRGKWENLNALLAEHDPHAFDWLLLVDDDVSLPRGFLDAFLFLAERFDFRLAQPAHRWRSHAAWSVTRRRGPAVARRTRFVEIGPVCALHRSTFDVLLPFPPLRAGWGLDTHWAAVAEREGWPMGVVDAVPVRHLLRAVGAAYPAEDAISEARTFLAERPYLPRDEANRTLAVHTSW